MLMMFDTLLLAVGWRVEIQKFQIVAVEGEIFFDMPPRSVPYKSVPELKRQEHYLDYSLAS
jgi:hypothetical protein